MVLWSDITDKNVIDSVPWGKEGRAKFSHEGGGPLRFQIPRGRCKWGVSAYKSFQLTVQNPDFIAWWKDLETFLCPQEPFNSNLKLNELRLKIDDATYIFDENSKQVNPEVREGLFRGQDLSVLVDIDSTYFFNGTWGLTCRAAQIRYYGQPAEEETARAAETFPSVLKLGACAFLPIDER
jgi:hypothetical protein